MYRGGGWVKCCLGSSRTSPEALSRLEGRHPETSPSISSGPGRRLVGRLDVHRHEAGAASAEPRARKRYGPAVTSTVSVS